MDEQFPHLQYWEKRELIIKEHIPKLKVTVATKVEGNGGNGGIYSNLMEKNTIPKFAYINET